ncbi:MAG: hypothetical protein E4H37_02175 [Gemmatimonadales bacterium]|nr:MAG: hypothetical protein E4H37_02175 [Gemmatimonadales bacterium]
MQPSPILQPDALATALDRLESYFAKPGNRAAILARHALGRARPTDLGLRDRLVREMRAETRPDGSIGGAVIPTIWRALELMELDHRGDQVGTIRVVGWILNLQGKPGAFGEGCTPARHEHRACNHHVGGFFSPGPSAQRISPVTLPNGAVYHTEEAARFAISCLALRAALRAGQEKRPLVGQHLQSLVDLEELWTEWGGYFAPDMATAALHALAIGPPPYRAALPKAAAFVSAQQAPDGSWPGADLFQAVDALAAAGTAEARAAISRAVPALLAQQQPDGTFGPVASDERALIALQGILLAQRELDLRTTSPL